MRVVAIPDTEAPTPNPHPEKANTMSTDKKGTKILARTFFTQLRAAGYTPQQIIGVATELLDLVTTEIRDGDKVETSVEVKEHQNRAQA